MPLQVIHQQPDPGRRQELDEGQAPVQQQQLDTVDKQDDCAGCPGNGAEPAFRSAEVASRSFDVNRVGGSDRDRERSQTFDQFSPRFRVVP